MGKIAIFLPCLISKNGVLKQISLTFPFLYPVLQALQESDVILPELFQCHGTADELVLHSWGEETNSRLKSLGVSTKFLSFPGVYHELSKAELEKLKSWILTKLPGEMERQSE